jgi:Ca2+-dependent lipid-binding protein
MYRLDIELIKGIDLLPVDFNGKSDPYIIFIYENEIVKSTTKKKNLSK